MHAKRFIQESLHRVDEEVTVDELENDTQILSHNMINLDINKAEHLNEFICMKCGISYSIYNHKLGKN